MTAIEFKREYLQQTCLIAMHAREEWSRHEANNIHCQLMQYAIASYIIKRAQYINWDLIQIDKRVFFDRLEEFKNGYLQTISQQLDNFAETLELSYLRNTIIGR